MTQDLINSLGALLLSLAPLSLVWYLFKNTDKDLEYLRSLRKNKEDSVVK